MKVTIPIKKALSYDCSKCPAYCCSYERIDVKNGDIKRLAEKFGLEFEEAKNRFTKIKEGDRVLRHRKDDVYGTICMFLDKDSRRCSIYEIRPKVCRSYPEATRCGYYDFLKWERRYQDDNEIIPLLRGER